MYSLLLFRAIYFFIFVACVTWTNRFHTYYVQRCREYKRAQTFLLTEPCTNPRVRAELGSYNLCDESERTMDVTPLHAAFKDIFSWLHICSDDYCSMLGMNITNSLPQIFLTFGILCMILLWVSDISFRQRRNKEENNYWSLPLKSKNK